MKDILLRCKNLLIGYDNAILPEINLDIEKSKLYFILGRNGSGKSTFINTLLGFTPCLSGEISINGDISYIPQVGSYENLLPIKVWEFVSYGKINRSNFMKSFSSKKDKERIMLSLKKLHMHDFANRLFKTLSSGEKQRVYFARMLYTGIKLSLLDEATSAMDYIIEKDLISHLKYLSKEHNFSIVLVSHNPLLAKIYADKVIFLDKENQKIICGDTKTIFTHKDFINQYGIIN